MKKMRTKMAQQPPPNLPVHTMKCMKCPHQWLDYPGGWGMHFGDGCPKCGSLYWTSTPPEKKNA